LVLLSRTGCGASNSVFAELEEALRLVALTTTAAHAFDNRTTD